MILLRQGLTHEPRVGRCTHIISLLALAGCAPQVVPVSVSAPKLWGDDHVLRTLAERHRVSVAQPLGAPIFTSPIQESFAVRQDQSSRLHAGVDLANQPNLDPESTPPPAHPSSCSCSRCTTLVIATVRPLPGLSAAEALQARSDHADLVASQTLVAHGDTALLDPRSRAVLLRFDVCFNGLQDLGDRRKFVVVAFVVRTKDGRAPVVYRLAPEVRALVSDEQLVDTASTERSVDVLGTWGGVGLTGGYQNRDQLARGFETVLATPLQFAIYRGAGNTSEGAFTFAFAFGPRRRLLERSLLNPARWFGSAYELVHELQAGPRSCEAVLLFPGVTPTTSLDLTVDVYCNGELVAEEQLDAARALGRRLETFRLACPADAPGLQTTRVLVLPTVTTDLVLDGPCFSEASQVVLGPLVVPAPDVVLAGRGRLLVRVRPSLALAQLAARGVSRVSCRVLTPDRPDFAFEAELGGGGK